MNDRPTQPDDLHATFAAYIDGRLSAAEANALEQRLLTDDDAADAYLRYTDLHAELAYRCGPARRIPAPQPTANQAVVRPDASSKPHAHVFPIVPLALAAALLVACGLAAYFLVFSDPQSESPDPQPQLHVATLIESSGSRVIHDGGVAHEGGEYPAGSYAITSGTAQFMLRNRVTVNLRGKTRLQMHHPGSVYLDHGHAVFNVPKGAAGFTVHLPDESKIVDLGTAFRVEIDDEGASELHVSEGLVRWTVADNADGSVLVHAGQTARLVDGRPVAAFDKTIEVVNHSFEEDGPSVESPLNGWTCSAPKGYGTQSIGGASRPADGKLVAWLNHQGTQRTLYQETEATIVAGTTYTLTVNVDQYGAFEGSTGRIRLYGSDGGFEQPLAELPVAPASGEALLDQSIRFTATDEQAGQTLGIALVVTGGVQLRWDNVRLTRSVPTLSPKDETDAEVSTDPEPLTTPIEDRQRAGEKVRQG